MKYEKYDLLFNIAKKLNLSAREYEMLVHDVNNLRGDEWLESVAELNDENLLKEFKELIHYYTDDEDED